MAVNKIINNIQVHAEDFTQAQMLEQARKKLSTYYAFGIFDNVELQAEVTTDRQRPSYGSLKKKDLGNILTRVKASAGLEQPRSAATSSHDDLLRLQIARAIYGNSSLFNYGNRAVPPITSS